MRSIGLPELVIFGLLFLLMPLWVIPFWKIFSKAGFPGAISLLTMIPVIGLITLYVIVFSEWPAMRQTAVRPLQNT